MMCPAEYRLCGHTEAVELFTRWIDSRLRQDEGAQQHGTYTVLSTQGNVGTARNFRGGVRGPGGRYHEKRFFEASSLGRRHRHHLANFKNCRWEFGQL